MSLKRNRSCTRLSTDEEFFPVSLDEPLRCLNLADVRRMLTPVLGDATGIFSLSFMVMTVCNTVDVLATAVSLMENAIQKKTFQAIFDKFGHVAVVVYCQLASKWDDDARVGHMHDVPSCWMTNGMVATLVNCSTAHFNLVEFEALQSINFEFPIV